MGIDVVVCAKNREKTIANVLSQIKNELPVENLIIIYGTSFDRTKEIALQYTDKVYWDEDRGLGAARNLGIRKASSKIVAMIDTDVLLPKSWYKRLARHFNNDKVAAAMGTCIFGYGCSPMQKYYEWGAANWQKQWGTHNVLFRRNTVLEIGNFNKGVQGAGEDYDIYNRLIEAGFEWIWDKEVVVRHPMTIFEHFRHNIWWAKGVTSLNDEKLFSLRQFLGRILYIIRNGFTYATIHLVLSLYIPLTEVIWLIIDFKTRSSRQKKAFKKKSAIHEE